MWYYLPHDTDEQPEPMEKAPYIKDHNVLYICPADKKAIYLTFDDCPNNENIPKILDILKKHNAPAAFFMTEDYIRKHPDVIKKISDGGHLICNHTSHHEVVCHMPFEKLEAELKGVEDAYREVTGRELDTMTAEAMKVEGVLGSRMTGAGFGGCTVNIVPEDKVDLFIKQVGQNYKEQTGITPEFYVSEIGDGAREIK
jgi:peptidoglycan/xylan/chitin deacetylase (PgdA/CDA1 family)